LYYCFYHSWIYILLASFYYHTVRNVRRGPSCTWSCGSWIYNYLCNQFTTTYAIRAYHHWCCEFESSTARCTTLCDKICKWHAAVRCFSPVSSTNQADRHDIAEILLKVALNNTIKPKT
jgi:hypothetical protein